VSSIYIQTVLER